MDLTPTFCVFSNVFYATIHYYYTLYLKMAYFKFNILQIIQCEQCAINGGITEQRKHHDRV